MTANSSSETAGRYAARGVSASKTEVHAAVDHLDRGLYPHAFCKITADHLTGRPDLCNVIHADGSGTKSLIAYLHYRETGDPSVFHGIAQDSIVMNIDDLLCVGVTGGILLSSTINRNARSIPGEVIAALIEGTEKVLERLRQFGVSIHSGGGETADVGDLTPTLTVDSCATAILPRNAVISGDNIVPGLEIIGISSAGKSNYEDTINSGIGSNGLTSARHDMLTKYYADTYPETVDPATPKDLVYCGPWKLTDPLPDSPLTVGEALLSPTRTYAPIIRDLLCHDRSAVRGLIHCSGGGQTKCLRFGRAVHFVKDNLMPIPPVFAAIQQASKTIWQEMFQVYNMGHRMEVYCRPADSAEILQRIHAFGVDANVIGHTEPATTANQSNHISIHHDGTIYHYP